MHTIIVHSMNWTSRGYKGDVFRRCLPSGLDPFVEACPNVLVLPSCSLTSLGLLSDAVSSLSDTLRSSDTDDAVRFLSECWR